MLAVYSFAALQKLRDTRFSNQWAVKREAKQASKHEKHACRAMTLACQADDLVTRSSATRQYQEVAIDHNFNVAAVLRFW